MKIYKFQSNNLCGYSFMVLANSSKEAWKLIKNYVSANKYYFLDDEFATDRRNYSIKEIEQDEPKVLEGWK